MLAPILLHIRFQASAICCIQSMHMIRTALVALTLFPQQGHCSLRVLLGLRSPVPTMLG